ncbi:tripartite tricarboxylate transporter TctB family protein [Antarctobacter sp.]|uniref:tripartite tricarboxylate transporter TctB family protein n=1 Tax=Antarctobacter sp. TaxID=1872577 RepID=UPI002B275549|nr:tripartite tricarboxylate transporter TctB family protein [Antarctobacter sp.]
MINVERIQGIVVLGFGIALLVWLVPTYVTSMPGDPLDPSIFPRAAAWILSGLGLAQIVLARPGGSVPAGREVFGFVCFILALVIAALLLPMVGFLPVACGLMLASLVLLRERRPLWAAMTLIGVPAFVWFLFTVLLSRSLS